MIPRTFPTNAAGAMVVLEVSPTGLREWVDYIPVELSTADNNTYNDLGNKVVEFLASGSGLVAWTDYIPVVTGTGDNWRSDDDGVIMVRDITA
jgi:hypothetical protein